jgi:hypothetical protein
MSGRLLFFSNVMKVPGSALRPDFNGEVAAMKLFNLLDKDSSGEITLEEIDMASDRPGGLCPEIGRRDFTVKHKLGALLDWKLQENILMWIKIESHQTPGRPRLSVRAPCRLIIGYRL